MTSRTTTTTTTTTNRYHYILIIWTTLYSTLDSFHRINDSGNKATVKVCSTSMGFVEFHDLFDQVRRHEWIACLPRILFLIAFIFIIVQCIVGNHVLTSPPAEHALS